VVTDTAWLMIHDPTDPRHGTTNGYRNLKCRCERCRRANADDAAQRKAARRNAPTPRRVHGTVNGYDNYSCRCARCTKAHTDAARNLRHRRKQQ
jgi:hypothetical protein